MAINPRQHNPTPFSGITHRGCQVCSATEFCTITTRTHHDHCSSPFTLMLHALIESNPPWLIRAYFEKVGSVALAALSVVLAVLEHWQVNHSNAGVPVTHHHAGAAPDCQPLRRRRNYDRLLRQVEKPRLRNHSQTASPLHQLC